MSNVARPTIAVLNSSEDTTEMLRTCLQDRGFSSVVIGHVTDIKRGHTDLVQFIDTHDPAVFVWDISIPYDDNWRFLHMVMSHEKMKGRQVVLTTTNKRALESLVGRTGAIEIIGKPYDLDDIVRAVERAAAISTEADRD